MNEVLNEVVDHLNWVRYVYRLTDNGWIISNSGLPADELDEHMERFVKTFFPEHYTELFE